MRAGLGPPPPTPYPIYNCSRVLKIGHCEEAYHVDYHLNVQYGPERPEYPAPWLGSYLHRFDELIHIQGWDNPDHILNQVQAEFNDKLPDGWEDDPKWAKNVALAPLLARQTHARYHNAQTWDCILGSEVEFWLEWLGVMWLGRIDCVVQQDGLVWDCDKKTSAKPLEEVLEDEINSLQRAVYGQALSQIGMTKWGLEYGGAIIDNVPTDVPVPKHTEPRTNKDGSLHKGDLKAIENHKSALAEYQSRLVRIKLREYAGYKYRADTVFGGGAVERVKRAEALRLGTMLPLRDGRWSRFGCRGCPHRVDCARRRTPDPADYYLREPDYVDIARERNHHATD